LADKNVIHRDVKVANIFINNNKVKIADFGFAKFTKYIHDNKEKHSRILT
jgi:serine/threonine protein kinase